MIELRSEVASPVLGRVVAKNAAKDNESELIGVGWRQLCLCSHVHEADVAQIAGDATRLRSNQLFNRLSVVVDH